MSPDERIVMRIALRLGVAIRIDPDGRLSMSPASRSRPKARAGGVMRGPSTAETSALLEEIRADIAALREESASRKMFSNLLRSAYAMPNTVVKATAAAQVDSSSKPQVAAAAPPDTQVRPGGLECHPETPSEPSQGDSPKHPEAPSDSGDSP
jgi:hypothetical protein